MRQLNRTETALLIAGGVLMVVSVGLYVFSVMPKVVCWSMLAGAVLFAGMQARQRYEGGDVTIRRLRRMILSGGACFVLAGLFMIENSFHFLEGWFSGSVSNYSLYVNIFHNNWVVLQLIASMLEIYGTHRINYELKKADEKHLNGE